MGPYEHVNIHQWAKSRCRLPQCVLVTLTSIQFVCHRSTSIFHGILQLYSSVHNNDHESSRNFSYTPFHLLCMYTLIPFCCCCFFSFHYCFFKAAKNNFKTANKKSILIELIMITTDIFQPLCSVSRLHFPSASLFVVVVVHKSTSARVSPDDNKRFLSPLRVVAAARNSIIMWNNQQQHTISRVCWLRLCGVVIISRRRRRCLFPTLQAIQAVLCVFFLLFFSFMKSQTKHTRPKEEVIRICYERPCDQRRQASLARRWAKSSGFSCFSSLRDAACFAQFSLALSLISDGIVLGVSSRHAISESHA